MSHEEPKPQRIWTNLNHTVHSPLSFPAFPNYPSSWLDCPCAYLGKAEADQSSHHGVAIFTYIKHHEIKKLFYKKENFEIFAVSIGLHINNKCYGFLSDRCLTFYNTLTNVQVFSCICHPSYAIYSFTVLTVLQIMCLPVLMHRLMENQPLKKETNQAPGT